MHGYHYPLLSAYKIKWSTHKIKHTLWSAPPLLSQALSPATTQKLRQAAWAGASRATSHHSSLGVAWGWCEFVKRGCKVYVSGAKGRLGGRLKIWAQACPSTAACT